MFIFVYHKSPRWISTGNPPEFHRKSTGNDSGNPPEMIPEKGRNLFSFGVWTLDSLKPQPLIKPKRGHHLRLVLRPSRTPPPVRHNTRMLFLQVIQTVTVSSLYTHTTIQNKQCFYSYPIILSTFPSCLPSVTPLC